MTSIIYDAGTVTISNGNTRAAGLYTNWLKDGIKQNDIFLIGGEVYEIASVTSNTELFLAKPYKGDTIQGAEYKIIQIAEQVIAADLAKKIQELIEKYNEREKAIVQTLVECQEYVAMWKKARLFIDSDGDLAQDDGTENPTVIIDGEAATLASPQDIQELLSELQIGQ